MYNINSIIIFFSCICLTGCIKKNKNIKDVNKEKETSLDIQSDLSLFDIESSKDIGIVYLPNAFSIQCFGVDGFIVSDYTVPGSMEELSILLRNIYVSEGFSIAETVKTSKYITFSGVKPLKSLTVVVIKKDKKYSMVHSSIMNQEII